VAEQYEREEGVEGGGVRGDGVGGGGVRVPEHGVPDDGNFFTKLTLKFDPAST
jgi:hypothetical protein